MAGSILTPMAIWGNFKVPFIPKAEIIDERQEGDIIVSRILIEGRVTPKGQVKICATVSRGVQLGFMPAVIIFKDFGDTDCSMDISIAKLGYMTFSIDIEGKREGKEFYTEYPEDLPYAVYENVKDDLKRVDKDIITTCWYEWAMVARYALKYIKSLPYVTKVGGIGVSSAATVLWQLALDKNLSAAAFVMNAGWTAYNGLYKFAGKADPQLSDDMLMFIAGVEPQSYAAHINCPALVVAATNSPRFDADRVTDTLARIKKDFFVALDYSVGRTDGIDSAGYKNILAFLNEFLMRENGGCDYPFNPEIKCEFSCGKVTAEVTADGHDLKEIALYSAEEILNPALRSWYKNDVYTEKSGNKYKFEYMPYADSGAAFFFARAVYKSGFALSTNICAVKFGEGEGGVRFKSNVVYSGRIQNAQSVFSALPKAGDKIHADVDGHAEVLVKTGPMDIAGIFAEKGLRTFKINAKKDRPADGAMLMLDFYSEGETELFVKLVADYFGKNRADYSVRVRVKGGNVWNNVKLNMQSFKTPEGMTLKSYKNINAIEFICDGAYLINNVLWV